MVAKKTPYTTAKILDLIVGKALSQEEIAAESGITTITVRHHIKPFLERNLVFIESWAPDDMGRLQTPMYRCAAFPKRSAKRPPPQSKAEVARRCRQKKKMRVSSVFELGQSGVKL